MGLVPNRTQTIFQHLDDFKVRFPNANFSAYGHSLGGTIAEHLGMKRPHMLKVASINPEKSVTRIDKIIRKFQRQKYFPNITTYKVITDIFSMTHLSCGTVIPVLPQKALLPHSLKNFMSTPQDQKQKHSEDLRNKDSNDNLVGGIKIRMKEFFINNKPSIRM